MDQTVLVETAGGGNGGFGPSTPNAGTNGRGGGGGGGPGASGNRNGAAGGNGVVILKSPTSGGTINVSGSGNQAQGQPDGSTICTFNVTGTVIF